MSELLDNGAVLPSGMLGSNGGAMMEGFNKSYQNFPLRVGVVTASYPVSSDRNKSKLTTEYDVLVIEQNADKGATTIQYRNCMSSEGLGSIADFFEYALRPKKKKTTKGDSVNLKGQDGAIVLLLCLDGMSDKGIIIGALTHPDRKTKLTDEGPLLEGEYNGVHITVNKDGSTKLVFNGATDNQGLPIDASQGKTILQIEKDGSFQASHDSITFRLDREGQVTLKAKKDISITADTNINIKCIDATITASGNAIVEGKTIKLGKNAAEAVIKGTSFADIYNKHTHIGNLGAPTTGPSAPMDSALSKKVKTE